MKNLNKNILRYLGKNKFITLSLSIFVFLVIMIFSMFQGMTSSMQKSYDTLVDNYNLHNVVIYDNWNQNAETSDVKKTEFYEQLDNLGIYYRQHESINIYSSDTDSTAKIIKYENDYLVDQLDVFEEKGLPINETNGRYLLPSGWDLEDIILKASTNLTVDSAKRENIFARQLLVYFAANSTLKSDATFGPQFSYVLDYIYSNPNFDPLNPSNSELSVSQIQKVQSYISMFVNQNDKDYTPPAIRGSRIAFMMEKKTLLGTPLNGYYEDPTSILAIVNPNWLSANNKEVLDFNEFVSAYTSKNINDVNSDDFVNDPMLINDLPRNTPSSMDTWINNLDDKYKVYVGKLPFVIIGTGITPDMMFPIINYDKLVPNPLTESIVYTNHSGYEKTDFSYGSSYHESYIACKYTGSETQSEITSKLNSYVEKYMAWPANVNAVYWFDDPNNILSPATLRVTFITQLLSVISGVTFGISIFIAILLIIVLCLFAKMFISSNKNTIAILMSNGISKWKIISNLTLIGLLISIVSIPIGYFIGMALQPIMYTVFSTYWMIPVNFAIFSAPWFFSLLIVPTIVFMGIIFIFSWYLLRKNVTSLLKEDQNVSLSKSSRYFKSIFNFAPIMIKFRGSLAFNSIAKIIFLTLSTITLSLAFSFISSSVNKIESAYQYELNTNQYAYQLDLVTPTIQSGQYYGVELGELGRTLVNNENQVVASKNYSSGLYKSAWNNSPLFQEYSLMHWASANDSSAYTNEIVYLKNLTEIMPIIDVTFGITGASTNPIEIVKSITPSNVLYTMYELMIDLASRQMSDMRPFNQAFAFKFGANGLPDTSLNSGYIQPISESTDENKINAYTFPTTWAIQNFGINNPNDWVLNYNNDENIGIISAPEIPGFESIENVLKMSREQIANLINNAYSTYSASTNTSDIPQYNDSIKYYSTDEIFSPEAISNIRIDPNNENIILFDVDIDKNSNKSLLTNRSLFTKQFYKSLEDISNWTNDEIQTKISVAQLFVDPFTSNTYYELNSKNALAVFGTHFKTTFINYVLLNYLDPAYSDYYFRIQYNQIVYNKETDEPYTNIEGRILNDNLNKDLLNICGIQQNSKFIKLYNNDGVLINDLLFNTEIDNPLIINNYVAKKYGLKVGDKLLINPENTVYRTTITNAAEFLEDPTIELEYDYSNIKNVEFEIVGINNTGNGSQLFTNMNTAQIALGLATAQDYNDHNKIASFPNEDNGYTIDVQMNNDYNTFGGFNGLFTSNQNSILLAENLSLYSLSGMYIASDAWEDSVTINTLIKNTLNNNKQISYLANAFNISVEDLQNLWKTYEENNADDFIKNVRNLYCTIYGKTSLNTVFESANSVEMSKVMFDQMSSLYDQVAMIVVALIILLCILAVILCSIMIINDMMKLIAILKTLGYSDKSNAINIIVGFIPSWLLTILISAPLSILAVNLFQQFVFTNLSIYIAISVNWPIFVVIQLFIAAIFAIIYGYSIYHFKKKDILTTIRW